MSRKKLDYIVLGIGLNVNQQQFPQPLAGLAPNTDAGEFSLQHGLFSVALALLLAELLLAWWIGRGWG